MSCWSASMVGRPALFVASCCVIALLAGCGNEDGGSSSTTQDSGAATGSDSTGGGSDATGGGTDGSSSDTTTGSDTSGSGVACHPIKNTGCPTGQHCIYDGDLITCTDDGEHALGEDCDDGKGCKVGICVAAQNGPSRCANFCVSDLHCASQLCSQLQSSKGKVCDMGGDNLIACDPLTQDCQDASLACYATPKGFGCLAKGAVDGGEKCAEDNSCLPGFACIGKSAGQDGICRKICRQGGGNPACDGVTEGCSKLYGSPTAGYCGG